jgi:regulator of sigma E protease
MVTQSLIVQILLSLAAISILVAWHEFGHYSMARLVGMRVLKFSIGFGPKVIGFVKSGIEYQISLLPIGGYVHIAGMTSLEEGASEDPKSFINRPKWAQLLVIFAGPFFNYLLAVVLFFCVFWFWSSGTTPSLLVNQVAKDSPAAMAGVRDGDVILKIDGQNLSGTQDFLSRIANSQGKPLHFSMKRDAQALEIDVTPKASDDGTFRIGVGYVPLSFSFSGAIGESFYQLWAQSTGILSQLGQAIFGSSKNVQLGGVVEITRQLSHAVEQGFKNVLWMMASLSVVLGLFNILPIPSLDGSKIFILCLEAIIRRPINATAQLWIHAVGIIFILGLMLLLTIGDVMRLYQAG